MLHELEIIINGKLCKLVFLHRSPSQNMKEFERSIKNLEWNLEFIFNKGPYLTVMFGDFNAKSYNWYKDDKTTGSRSKLEIRLLIMDLLK